MTFKSPNYTQVPNDLFDMAKDMSESELRTTLALIRQTFGFHRLGVKMSIPELSEATGLSDQGVRNGTTAAESRGTFKRSNPGNQGKAEWELCVEPSTELTPQQVDPTPNLVDPTPHVTLTTGTVLKKEKKIKKKKDYLDLLQELAVAEPTKQQLQVAGLYDKMDSLFRTTFQRNKNTDVVVKFILQREAQGESIERFVQWANRDEFNASRIWEYAENPIKIKTRWQVAMGDTKNSNEHSKFEGV